MKLGKRFLALLTFVGLATGIVDAFGQADVSPPEQIQTIDPDKLDPLPRGLVGPKPLNSQVITPELMMQVRVMPGKSFVARFLVLEDGTVTNIEVVTSTGVPEIDDAAKASISGWRFMPATVAGKVVRFWARTELRPSEKQRSDACFNIKAAIPSDLKIQLCTNLIETPGIAESDLANAYWARGVAYFDKGNFDDAINNYNAAIKVFPRSPYVILDLAIAYSGKRDYDRATEEINRALQISPTFNKDPFAIERYSDAVRLDSTNVWAIKYRGLAYDATGEWQQALRDYDRAIELSPADATLFIARARTYTNLQLTERAIADLDKAVAVDPRSAAARYNRGLIYSLSTQYLKAELDLDKAIEIDSNYVLAFIARADVKLSEHAYSDGVADISRAIQLDANNVDLINRRCFIRALWGQEVEQGLDDCNGSLKQKPHNAIYLNTRALVYLRLMRYQEAIADCDAALEASPGMPSTLFLRGVTKFRLGDPGGGNEDITAARGIDPHAGETLSTHGIGP